MLVVMVCVRKGGIRRGKEDALTILNPFMGEDFWATFTRVITLYLIKEPLLLLSRTINLGLSCLSPLSLHLLYTSFQLS